MTEKEELFCKELIDLLLDDVNNSEGVPLYVVYRFELEDFLKKMEHDLKVLINTFDSFNIDDLQKIIAINFSYIEPKFNDENLLEVARLYDDMLGDVVGDKYGFI